MSNKLIILWVFIFGNFHSHNYNDHYLKWSKKLALNIKNIKYQTSQFSFSRKYFSFYIIDMNVILKINGFENSIEKIIASLIYIKKSTLTI